MTPTLMLPARLGSSLPQPLIPISVGNFAALKELAYYGTAHIYDTFFSPDRSRIFALTGEGIKVYTTETIERLAWFKDINPFRSNGSGQTWEFSTSRDGDRFSILDANGQAQVYDLKDGLIYTTTLPSHWSPWVTLANDGLHLAMAQLGAEEWIPRWQLVEISTGDIVADGVGSNVRFSPIGTYVVGNASDILHIYRTSDWQEQTQIGLRAGGETALEWSFSPDDRYLVVVMPSGITVWEVDTRKIVRLYYPTTGTEATISKAFFSEDSSQVAIVKSPFLLVLNIADGSVVSVETIEESGVFDYDKVLLEENGLHGFWVPYESDGSKYQAPQSSDWQLAFDFSNNGLSLVNYAGWDYENNQRVYQACNFIFMPASQADCIEVFDALGVTTDNHGQFYSLWQAEGDEVSLYNGLDQSSTPVITFETGDFPVNLLGVSPDNRLLVYSLGYGGSTLQVRELAGGRLLLNEETTGKIEQVRFNADGSRMVVSIRWSQLLHPQVLVYDSMLNAVLFRWPAQDMMNASSALLSPDGEHLVYRFERSDALRWYGIQVWNPLHQLKITEWDESGGEVGTPLAFSPDGMLLATAGNLGTVFLLDAESGQVVHQWKAHMDTIYNVAFSPDSLLLATSGADGLIRLWGIWP